MNKPPEAWLNMFDTTAAFGVGENFARTYVTALLTDELPDSRDAVAAFDDVLNGIGGAVSVIDSGLADAMRQILDRTVTTTHLLAAVREQFEDPIHHAMVAAGNHTFLTNVRAIAAASPGDSSNLAQLVHILG